MTDERTVKKFASSLRGGVMTGEPLSGHTTFRIGGPARLMILPADADDLMAGLELCAEGGIPYFILGNGSNLVFPDEGFPGAVFKMRSLNRAAVEGARVRAGAGAMLPRLARLAMRNSLGGLEFAAGIPGTAGGAVVMNAGDSDGATGDLVEEVRVLEGGTQKTLRRADLAFAYRHSAFRKRKGAVAVEVVLELRQERDPAEIGRRTAEKIRRRRERFPLSLPNAGSVFRNPAGDYAGRLIEAAGCKGMSEGGAEVSSRHANFIVNRGGATGADVAALIKRVQEKVFESSGVLLEPEVELVRVPV
ncbi:MAG: UDP-N-acetylmuramate dehydrogenase [bacterium]